MWVHAESQLSEKALLIFNSFSEKTCTYLLFKGYLSLLAISGNISIYLKKPVFVFIVSLGEL